jgi:hypothetical protein
LAFEFLKGHIYDKRGAKTVRLKGAKNGWEKRQYTLQIAVFADGVLCYKPLLMFKGKEHSTDRRQIMEIRKYHPGVLVIFNPKAYANTSNLINWVKHQYSPATAYLLSDKEPRFLSLDAFAPHKNRGKKQVANESQQASEKRQQEEQL